MRINIINRAKGMVLSVLPENSLRMIKKLHYCCRLKFSSAMEEIDFKIVRKLIKPGDYVLDIGANIGVYTKLLSELAGDEGKVYSIEPIPSTFAILSSNVKLLGLRNVELLNYAISDTHRKVIMQVPLYETGGENFYEASIVNGNFAHSLRRIEAETKTVDSLFGESLHHISFIKCDAEGHELECVKGAAMVIHKFKPVWLIEISHNPDDPQFKAFAIFKFLSEYGYEPYWFDDGRLRKRNFGDKSVNYFFLTPAHLDNPCLTA